MPDSLFVVARHLLSIMVKLKVQNLVLTLYTGEKICDPLTDEITKILGNSLLNGRDILLEVHVDDYPRLRSFQRRIGQLFGVKQVNQQYYKNGKASFFLKFTGSTQTLADIVSTTYFMDIQVTIIELSSDIKRYGNDEKYCSFIKRPYSSNYGFF